MSVRKGTVVHPASFNLVLKLKDEVGMTYEEIAHLTGVTPSRIQQIVLHQRKRVGENDYSGTSSQP